MSLIAVGGKVLCNGGNRGYAQKGGDEKQACWRHDETSKSAELNRGIVTAARVCWITWEGVMANTKSRTHARPRIIASDSDIRDGVRALRRKCAIMRRVHDAAGHPPLRRRPAGFEGLARIIVGQQVSVASASAIWTRTAKACRPFEPAVLLALEDKHLAGAGLSRPKIRTLRAIATAC